MSILKIKKVKSTGKWKVWKSLSYVPLTKSKSWDTFLEAYEGARKQYPDDWIDAEIDDSHGYYMKIDDWLEACEEGAFIDYDGHGSLMKGEEFLNEFSVSPSQRKNISKVADGILWYNR